MKKRIIITENQYKEIFSNNKYYKILVNEQWDNIASKIAKKIGNLTKFSEPFKPLRTNLKTLESELDNLRSLPTTNNNNLRISQKRSSIRAVKDSLKDKFRVKIGSDNLGKLDDIFPNYDIYDPESLIYALNNKGNLTKEELGDLYKIDFNFDDNGTTTFKTILLNTIKGDENVEKLFRTYRSINKRLKQTHPSNIKINDVINRHIPTDIKNDLVRDDSFARSVEKSELIDNIPDPISVWNPESILNDIPDNVDELEELIEKMKSQLENLNTLYTNPVSVWDKTSRDLWNTFQSNLSKTDVQKITSKYEELEMLINKNGIKPKEFYKKLIDITPNKWKRLVLKIPGPLKGITIPTAYFLGLLFVGVPIGATIYDLYDYVMKDKSKKVDGTDIKSKFLPWLKINDKGLYDKVILNPKDYTTTTDNDTLIIKNKEGKSLYFLYDKATDTFKETEEIVGTFENSLDGFKEFLKLNPNEKANAEDTPNGVTDIFTISGSSGVPYVTFNFENNTFVEKEQ